MNLLSVTTRVDIAHGFIVVAAGTTFSCEEGLARSFGDKVTLNGPGDISTVLSGGGTPATSFVGLSDKASADIPSINTPVGNALTAKAPKASPTFTGTVTVPTPAQDDTTTAAASTAFVLNQASTATPQAPGNAAAGSATRWSRGDHVHAQDTAKAGVAQVFSYKVGPIASLTDGVLDTFRHTFACTLTDAYVSDASGTSSIQIKKNGANVGSANAMASIEAHQTISTGNTFADGDVMTLVASSSTSCVNGMVTLKFQRTLAG